MRIATHDAIIEFFRSLLEREAYLVKREALEVGVERPSQETSELQQRFAEKEADRLSEISQTLAQPIVQTLKKW